MSGVPVGDRVGLYKLKGNEWYFCASGYLNPLMLEIGKRVWVGSVSSRDGFRTTEVTEILDTDFSEAIEFKTKNDSRYLIISLKSDDLHKVTDTSEKQSSILN